MKEIDYKERIGERWGELTIIGIEKEKGKKVIARCKCSCGKEIKTQYTNLTHGRTKGCGHLQEASRKSKENKHRTHGMTGTRINNVWSGMIERCENKNASNYKNYGGRGIKVCKEWREDFINFYNWAKENGYEERLSNKNHNKISLDRIDNNRDYEPSNCRWVTIEIQSYNKRTSYFTIEEIEKIRKLGFAPATIKQRMKKKNITLEEALKKPLYVRWNKFEESDIM